MDEARERLKHVRAEPGDPHRCSAVSASGGPCIFLSVEREPGVFNKYCDLHGGAERAGLKRKTVQIYLRQKGRNHLDELQDDLFDNLDDELALLRGTLQNALETYTQVELVTQMPQVAAMVAAIQSCLTANKKHKSAMGQLMDRAAISKLCDELVTVIGAFVDASKLDELSERVADAVARAVASTQRSE